MKKIYVLNGVGASGKGAFAEFVGKYIPSHKYSIVDLPKEAAKILGWNGGKDEKDRRFLSDIMDLSSEYNDAPFKDIISIVSDFKNNQIESDVLFIDMRDPIDIARAVKTFGASTILIRKPGVEKIITNHADANVEDYMYDYIIENDGTLKQLEAVAKMFANYVIREDCLDLTGVNFIKKNNNVLTTIKCSAY